MKDQLLELEAVHKDFEPLGKELFKVCDGKLFPADALFLSSCNRALQVLDSFILLIKNDYYSCSMALLRLQLDTVLRLHGLTKTKDIHASANKVIQGTKLSNIKDKKGKKLQDGYLVDLLAIQNPWIKHVYKLCSGYVHLSDSSFYHLIKKSESIPQSGEREFYIGSDESEIEEQHKLELIQAFKVATIGIQKLVTEWIEKRHHFGTNEELEKLYTQNA
ncbi:MAG: hypothetical protein WAqMacA_41010 [Shewanella algae]